MSVLQGAAIKQTIFVQGPLIIGFFIIGGFIFTQE